MDLTKELIKIVSSFEKFYKTFSLQSLITFLSSFSVYHMSKKNP